MHFTVIILFHVWINFHLDCYMSWEKSCTEMLLFFKCIYTAHPGDFIEQTSDLVMYLFETLKCLPKTFRIKKQILASETKPFMI